MWTNTACDYVIAQVSLHGSDFRVALLQMMDAPMMMKMLSSFDGVAGVQRPLDDDGNPLEKADDKEDDSEPSAPTEVIIGAIIGAGRVHRGVAARSGRAAGELEVLHSERSRPVLSDVLPAG